MRLPALLLAAALATLAGAQSKNTRELMQFRAAYASAQKSLTAYPRDPKARKGFVAAGDRLALFTMSADSLTPHEKYAGALKIYREVLKVDPKDGEAKSNSNLILSIYKQMHRPIPN